MEPLLKRLRSRGPIVEDEVEKAVKEGSCGGGRVMVLQSSLALSKTWRSARRSTMEVKAAEAEAAEATEEAEATAGVAAEAEAEVEGVAEEAVEAEAEVVEVDMQTDAAAEDIHNTTTPPHHHPIPSQLTPHPHHYHSLSLISPPLTTTHYHSLSLTTTHYHSLPLTTTHYHSLPLTTTHYHWLITAHYPSLPLPTTPYHSLPLTTTHYHSLPLAHYRSLPVTTSHYHWLTTTWSAIVEWIECFGCNASSDSVVVLTAQAAGKSGCRGGNDGGRLLRQVGPRCMLSQPGRFEVQALYISPDLLLSTPGAPWCASLVCVDVDGGRVHRTCGRNHAAELERLRLGVSPLIECAFDGCTRGGRHDASGRVHPCCCLQHAEQWANARGAGIAAECALPGCTRLGWVDAFPPRVYECCSLAHARLLTPPPDLPPTPPPSPPLSDSEDGGRFVDTDLSAALGHDHQELPFSVSEESVDDMLQYLLDPSAPSSEYSPVVAAIRKVAFNVDFDDREQLESNARDHTPTLRSALLCRDLRELTAILGYPKPKAAGLDGVAAVVARLKWHTSYRTDRQAFEAFGVPGKTFKEYKHRIRCERMPQQYEPKGRIGSHLHAEQAANWYDSRKYTDEQNWQQMSYLLQGAPASPAHVPPPPLLAPAPRRPQPGYFGDAWSSPAEPGELRLPADSPPVSAPPSPPASDVQVQVKPGDR